MRPGKLKAGMLAVPPALLIGLVLSLSFEFGFSLVSFTATVVIKPVATQAFIGYRSNTGTYLLNSPKSRTWNGSLWASESEIPTAGSPVRQVRVAWCTISSRSYERIVATLSDDGYIDAYVWTGAGWLVTNNIGYYGAAASNFRWFDIEYESNSGRALLVYSINGGKDTFGYRIWNGTAWSNQLTLDLATVTGEIHWISLARKPVGNSNEIAMMTLDHDRDVYGVIWNGTQFGNKQLLSAAAAGENPECVAVAYEYVRGYATFVWAENTGYSYSRQWTSSAWTSSTQINLNGGATTDLWFSLKSDPVSNRLMLTDVDNTNDLNTACWNGSTWTVTMNQNTALDAKNSRCADFAWEPTGSKGLLVYAAASGSLIYRTFTAPSTWGTELTITAAGTHPWVQLRRNPLDPTAKIKILGAMLNSNFDLGALKWDGTTLTNIGDAAFTAETTDTAYECFELEFRLTNP